MSSTAACFRRHLKRIRRIPSWRSRHGPRSTSPIGCERVSCERNAASRAEDARNDRPDVRISVPGRRALRPARTRHSRAGRRAGPYTPTFFTPAEYTTLARLTDVIIPASTTPSASNAGVPEYIDRVVSMNTEHQALDPQRTRLARGSGAHAIRKRLSGSFGRRTHRHSPASQRRSRSPAARGAAKAVSQGYEARPRLLRRDQRQVVAGIRAAAQRRLTPTIQHHQFGCSG